MTTYLIAKTHMENSTTHTFEEVIAELLPPIDESLAERDVPLHQRPHKAAMMIVEHCTLDIKGESKDGYLIKPWFGSLLAATIDWYKRIYDKALSTNRENAHTATILIRNTPFLIRIPLSISTAKEADNTFWIRFLSSVQSDDDPFSWVVDPPSFTELSEDQLGEVAQEICKAAENARVIWSTLLTVDHISEKARRHSRLVLPYLESAAKLIAKYDSIALSSAIWEVNFAAEQAIKSHLLQKKSVKIPNTHDIKTLHNLVTWNTSPSQSLIDSIALMPSGENAIRYRYSELENPSVFKVMTLYKASQTICRHYVQILPRSIKLDNAGFKMQSPPMPD